MKRKTVLSPFLFLIRIGIGGLFISSVLFVFFPVELNWLVNSSPFFLLHDIFLSCIRNLPGFDKYWLDVVSLVTISLYVYGFLAAILVTRNFLFPVGAGAFLDGSGRGQWNLFSYVIGVSPTSKNRLSISEDREALFGAIRKYSTSRKAIASVCLDIVVVAALSYIGYSSLHEAPTPGGLFARIIDSVLIGFWCYCIFSIFVWCIFVLLAWLCCLFDRT